MIIVMIILFEKSNNMNAPLLSFLTDQPLLTVVRGLFYSAGPKHLREIASDAELSPAGVSDILRRLDAAGVLEVSQQANRKNFSLLVSTEEADILENFFKLQSRAFLKKRAEQFSKAAPAKMKWMEEAYDYVHTIKRNLR